MLSFISDGHNEAEFGMSWCAGFGGSFYNAYFEVSIPPQRYELYEYQNYGFLSYPKNYPPKHGAQ